MTPTETTDILRQFNEWQKGDGPLDYSPNGLINAVDTAIEMIETAEKERVIDEQRIADLMADLNRVGHENEELRAKIAKMDNQKPIDWLHETRRKGEEK